MQCVCVCVELPHRPVCVAGVSGGLLQAGGAELLEAEVEAEGRVVVGGRGAPGGSWVSMEHAAALLAARPRVLLLGMALSVTQLHHLEARTGADTQSNTLGCYSVGFCNWPTIHRRYEKAEVAGSNPSPASLLWAEVFAK